MSSFSVRGDKRTLNEEEKKSPMPSRKGDRCFLVATAAATAAAAITAATTTAAATTATGALFARAGFVDGQFTAADVFVV